MLENVITLIGKSHCNWFRARIVQSVKWMATGWTAWLQFLEGGRIFIFARRPERLSDPHSLLYVGIENVFPQVKWPSEDAKVATQL
jgi:hypothetical protein